jgi:hypothetical protein
VTGVVGVSIYTSDRCSYRGQYSYRCQVAIESVYLQVTDIAIRVSIATGVRHSIGG